MDVNAELEKAGFAEITTGGGCTALELELQGPNGPERLMITCELNAPSQEEWEGNTPDDCPIILGYYTSEEHSECDNYVEVRSFQDVVDGMWKLAKIDFTDFIEDQDDDPYDGRKGNNGLSIGRTYQLLKQHVESLGELRVLTEQKEVLEKAQQINIAAGMLVKKLTAMYEN